MILAFDVDFYVILFTKHAHCFLWKWIRCFCALMNSLSLCL